MSGGPKPEDLAPQWQAYAAQRGLDYYPNWGIPEVTQLLHHADFCDAPNVIIGNLPGGLAGSWLAHYRLEGAAVGGGRCYTVVVVAAAASVSYAVRVICHDRDLPRRDASNPDADLQSIEMDDRAVAVESDAFLKRYKVSTDHDQNQVRAWQLFDPALIHWLTDQAPENFSFELQNGALCGFVPGAVADAGALDALCEATALVHTRVLEIGSDPAAAAAPAEAGSREDAVDRALAEHPFEKPPGSARAAALHFGLPLISHTSRQLGAEAFFRTHADALGLELVEPDEFMAAHIEIAVPGSITQVARGRLPHTDLDGYLIFTSDSDAGGWSVLVADISQSDNGFAFAGSPAEAQAKKDGLDISSNGSTITVWKPDGSPFSQTARKLDRFLEQAGPILDASYKAAKSLR
jgi:hypothetical protein